MKIVYLSDYRHLITDNDTTLALMEALRECRKYSPVTLSLCGEEWHFYKKYATEREYYISNNDYSKKSIIFPLMDYKDLTVDGEGAALQFHGTVCPFVIDGSSNITLKNFSVDYPRPYIFQATIAEAEEDRLVLDVDPASMPARAESNKITFYNPDDGWTRSSDRFLVCEFEKEKRAPSATKPPYFLYMRKGDDGSFLSNMYRYVEGEMLSETRMCFKGHFRHTHTVGNKLIGACGPGDRECPGIFGNRSENILIEDVTLYAAAAMGIICQICRNVTLLRVRTVPNEAFDRYLSVSADSTHFVNCSGEIRYDNCTFTNMMDDAGNVHGIYYKIDRVIDSHTLLLTYGHHQQEGINVFDTGDTVALVGNLDFSELATLTVKDAEQISADILRLEVEEELPPIPEGTAVENITKQPDLYITDCVTGNNRPRGFLLATRGKTVVTGNTFFNMNSGIFSAGDCNSWFESSPVGDVLIKGNKFKNSAYAGGYPITFNPHVLKGNRPFHRNVTITENEFVMHEERFLYASFTEGLVFENNSYTEDTSLPSHPTSAPGGVWLKECADARIEAPKKLIRGKNDICMP